MPAIGGYSKGESSLKVATEYEDARIWFEGVARGHVFRRKVARLVFVSCESRVHGVGSMVIDVCDGYRGQWVDVGGDGGVECGVVPRRVASKAVSPPSGSPFGMREKATPEGF